MRAAPAPAPSFDPTRRFVRIVEMRADGMVEFEFAVGEPELFVEMILPRAAFEDFCAREQVQPTLAATARVVAGDGRGWTLHEARTQRFTRIDDAPAPPSG